MLSMEAAWKVADLELSHEQDMQISNKDRDGSGLPATENYSAWTAQEMLRPELSSPGKKLFQKSQQPKTQCLFLGYACQK